MINIYEKVFSAFSNYCDQQNELNAKQTSVKAEYERKMLVLSNNVESKKAESAEHVKKLNAFIEIAKDHTFRREDTGQIEEYDSGLLSRLAVQINNASKADGYAEQLFIHASNQLRGIRQGLKRIDLWYGQEKARLDNTYQTQLYTINRERDVLNQCIRSFVNSDELKLFFEGIKADERVFEGYDSEYESSCKEILKISIGTHRKKLAIPYGFEEEVAAVSAGVFDRETQTIGIPEGVDIHEGSGVLIEYYQEDEAALLSGISNFILNTLKYHGGAFQQIVFVDPIRYSNSSLGVLQPLAMGDDPAIDHVPNSQEEVRKKVSSVLEQINSEEQKVNTGSGYTIPRRMLIFHNYPHGYDSTTINQIRKLFANSRHNNVTVLVTFNLSATSTIAADAISFIKTTAKTILCTGSADSEREKNIFQWYSLPSVLPKTVKKKYIDEKPILDTSNDYEQRVGIGTGCSYVKGVRRLEKIPYGVDEKGIIQTLDFEDGNFATFICGAPRSGKSTLLHTIITGLIRSNHPDDIEIWLIDFKMTEFSRYIAHRPPHVRYIILDESPELVYDIIDRLTEILMKRQNAFKGKWLKLSEVPDERYMPAILVIIDEFSIMSQIVADSISTSKDNYSIKLQNLLAKGAALGLHFIFASQSFSDGTRGLNDYSKKQIQQRIAMKAAYNEIKETLDLKSTSDEDHIMMERLPRHHALVRIPVDGRGNHLKQTKVLYISDYSKQWALIDSINRELHTSAKFSPENILEYIDKKALLKDGNSYTSFDAHRDEMSEYVNGRTRIERDELLLFLGEPRRMLPLFPIETNNGFSENILIVSPINEVMATASVLMSIAESLKLVGKKIDVWSFPKNDIYRQMIIESRQNVGEVVNDLGGICRRIKSIREAVEQKREGDKYIVILGSEELLMDMSFQEESREAVSISGGSTAGGTISIKKRPSGAPDLNSLLDSLSSGNSERWTAYKERGEIDKKDFIKAETTPDEPYDARADFKYILTQGSKMGYHFVIVFNSVGEYNQSKLDLALFKHRIVFRLAKPDAVSIIGTAGASAVTEMGDHVFRYTNGIESLSFRPFLHKGLSWDGWMMTDDGILNAGDEEEYLM